MFEADGPGPDFDDDWDLDSDEDAFHGPEDFDDIDGFDDVRVETRAGESSGDDED